jgi:hypothetical protein
LQRSLQDPRTAEAATQCLNAMVTDALQHLPFCLQYLELLRHKKVGTSSLTSATGRSCIIPFHTTARFLSASRVFGGKVDP